MDVMSEIVVNPLDFKVGKKMRLVPAINIDFYGHAQCDPLPATVISINRPHRFFRVEFDHGNGIKSIEAFKFCEEGDLACNLLRV